MQLDLDKMTLSNACDGIPEMQFQEHIDEIIERIRDAESDPHRYDKPAKLRFTVTVKLEFEHSVGDGITAITGSTAVKHPKQRAVKRSVILRGDTIYVEPPAGVQEPLPLTQAPRVVVDAQE